MENMRNRESNVQKLQGKLLLSTSSISNEYLKKTIIFVCDHGKNGAMGVIINKLVPNMSVRCILEKLHMNTDGVEDLEIHFGGLDEMDRCFVVHSSDHMAPGSKLIMEGLAISTDEDVLGIVSCATPKRKMLCMGCCIWTPEQLESEVTGGQWIAVDGDEKLIFDDPREDKWNAALSKIGSSTNLFSHIEGSA
ncbi:MAG: YqgE/AlgH family protein [Holosporaceae bacterium]|jgi:putative transcriptional regulator|nr:YqgE/AlgH family protein [Holosporaceae bacterium]